MKRIYKYTGSTRSKTPFWNALVSETQFRLYWHPQMKFLITHNEALSKIRF